MKDVLLTVQWIWVMSKGLHYYVLLKQSRVTSNLIEQYKPGR